jgi:hypothetical protein
MLRRTKTIRNCHQIQPHNNATAKASWQLAPEFWHYFGQWPHSAAYLRWIASGLSRMLIGTVD